MIRRVIPLCAAVILCLPPVARAGEHGGGDKIFHLDRHSTAARRGLAYAQQIPSALRRRGQPNISSFDAGASGACRIWLRSVTRCHDIAEGTPENRFVRALVANSASQARLPIERELASAGVPVIEDVPAIAVIAPKPRPDPALLPSAALAGIAIPPAGP